MTDELERRLADLVSSATGRRVDDVSAAWRSLGLDSLDRLSIIVTVEDEFAVRIPDLVAVRWGCVVDVAEWLRGNPATA